MESKFAFAEIQVLPDKMRRADYEQQPANKNRNRAAAIAALLTCRTFGDAAEQAGISESTLWRYMKDETFISELNEQRRQIIRASVNKMQNAAWQCVDVLLDVANNKQYSGMERTAAASKLLEHIAKFQTLGEVEERLSALERNFNDNTISANSTAGSASLSGSPGTPRQFGSEDTDSDRQSDEEPTFRVLQPSSDYSD